MKALKNLILLFVMSLSFLSCTAVLTEDTSIDRDYYDSTIYYVYGGSYYRYWYNGTWTYFPISYGYTWRPSWHPHHQFWHHNPEIHRPIGPHHDNVHHWGNHHKPNGGHGTQQRPNTGHQRPQTHSGGATHNHPNNRPSGRPNTTQIRPRTNTGAAQSNRPSSGAGSRSFGNGSRR